jgi:hypothetical protein
METKGRRAPRATGSIAAPAQPVEPIEIPVAAAGPAESSTESPEPTQLPAETAEPAETALDVVTTTADAAPQPSITIPASAATSSTPNEIAHFNRDALAALSQSQAALARGLEALSAEMAGMALSGIDTATRTATKMLSVKTLSDAIAVNAGYTCSSLDALVGGSAKLSELGVKLATETCQPILSQFGKGWGVKNRSAS